MNFHKRSFQRFSVCADCGCGFWLPKWRGLHRFGESHNCRSKLGVALRKVFAPVTPITATRSSPVHRPSRVARIAKFAGAVKAMAAAVIGFFTTDRVLHPA